MATPKRTSTVSTPLRPTFSSWLPDAAAVKTARSVIPPIVMIAPDANGERSFYCRSQSTPYFGKLLLWLPALATLLDLSISRELTVEALPPGSPSLFDDPDYSELPVMEYLEPCERFGLYNSSMGAFVYDGSQAEAAGQAILFECNLSIDTLRMGARRSWAYGPRDPDAVLISAESLMTESLDGTYV